MSIGKLIEFGSLNRFIAKFLNHYVTHPDFPNDPHPPDFVNDPALTLLLLEKMGQGHVQLRRERYGNFGDLTELWQVDYDTISVAYKNLGYAVAKAFALRNGWLSAAEDGPPPLGKSKV